jgi:hypothetical protein
MAQLFIVRDPNGTVTGLTSTWQEGAESADLDDENVRGFLRELDVDLVRVLEDVVDLLVARGIFRFTDLPESAQQKLLFRKNLRSQWQPVPDPLASDEGLF